MHPVTIIIGLLVALLAVVVAWTGMPLAWALVCGLVLVAVLLLAAFLWLAEASSWR